MDVLYGNRQQLAAIAEGAQEVLATAKAIFPFDLFPDSIVVDRTKVTFHKREFFGAADTINIQIEDILNAEVAAGPFLATLKVYTRIPNKKAIKINNLSRKQAFLIQSIIEGYNIARARKIDCSTISKVDLVRLLTQLGQEAGAS
jgi:hypothetical protein